MSGVPSPDFSDAELVRAARQRVRVFAWSANLAGACVVFCAVGFLLPLVADPDRAPLLGLVNASAAAVLLLGAGGLVSRRFGREMHEALRWIGEGRPPTAGEHRRTLMLAAVDLRLCAIAWAVGGAGVFALNAAVESWAFAAVAAAATWLGGETTCALTYLLDERALRPVTARALAARPTDAPAALAVRQRLQWGWALGTGVPLLGIAVTGAVGLAADDVDAGYLSSAVLFLAVVAFVTGTLSTVFAADAIAEPLLRVRRALERVRRGQLDVRVAVDDGSEVGLLQAGFNEMVDGLRERERLRDLFGRQVGDDVARTALRDGVRFAGEEREVGVLFVDLVGSTALATTAPPREVVALLNRFFATVVAVVEAECGLVNKFQGDAALCVFGAPVTRDDPAGDVLRAARSLAGRLTEELPEVDFGIGVSAGIAVAGNVGAERRFEYTVVGDPVNEAARLCELAKQRPERVLASGAAVRRAADAAERHAWSPTGATVLRGRTAATELARPVSALGPATEQRAPAPR